MRWSGKIVSKLQELQGGIKYLLDADLSLDIAKALRLLEFDIIRTDEVLEFQDHLNELYDPEIITWCKDNGRIWITHDFDAQRKHIEAIKLARINVVWIRINTKQNVAVPNESITWRIFKVLVRTIDGIQNHLFSSHGALHFRINLQSGKSPTIDWAENSKLDMPTKYH